MTLDLLLNPSEEQRSFYYPWASLSTVTLDNLIPFSSDRSINRINVILGPLYSQVDKILLCFTVLYLRNKAKPSTIVSYTNVFTDVQQASGLFGWFPTFHQKIFLLSTETVIRVPAPTNRHGLFPSESTEPLYDGVGTLRSFILASATPQSNSGLKLDDVRQSVFATLGLGNFDTVQSVTLPCGALSASVFNKLSSLPSLHTVSFSYIDDQPFDLGSWSVSLSGFRTLHTIHFSGSLTQVQKVIVACCPESDNTPLRILTITTPRLENENETTRLAETLYKRGKMLQKLTLDMQGLHQNEHREWMKLSLFEKLTELEEFVVKHPRPLPLTHRHLKNLLQGLQKAKWISLNPRPTEPAWQSDQTVHILTLDCIRIVVECRGPGLVRLGLGLDTSRGDVDPWIRCYELKEFECRYGQLTERGRQVIQRTFPEATFYY